MVYSPLPGALYPSWVSTCRRSPIGTLTIVLAIGTTLWYNRQFPIISSANCVTQALLTLIGPCLRNLWVTPPSPDLVPLWRVCRWTSPPRPNFAVSPPNIQFSPFQDRSRHLLSISSWSALVQFCRPVWSVPTWYWWHRGTGRLSSLRLYRSVLRDTLSASDDWALTFRPFEQIYNRSYLPSCLDWRLSVWWSGQNWRFCRAPAAISTLLTTSQAA